MKIYIDDREDKKRAKKIKFKMNIPCEITRLDVGDIVIKREYQPDISIEIKTVQDFCSSVKNNRLKKEVLQMQEKYDYSYVFIYGDLDDIKFNKFCSLTSTQIWGTIISLTVKYKIPVILMDNIEDICYCIGALIDKVKKESEPIEKPIVRDKDLNPYINILIGIPGVGKKTARKLLDYFKTPQAVLNATEDELNQIKGLSKKAKESILQMQN